MLVLNVPQNSECLTYWAKHTTLVSDGYYVKPNTWEKINFPISPQTPRVWIEPVYKYPLFLDMMNLFPQYLHSIDMRDSPSLGYGWLYPYNGTCRLFKSNFDSSD